MKIFVERIKKSIIFAPSNIKQRSYMETKSSSNIDLAAKQLWQNICDFSNLLYDNIHDQSSLHLYLEFSKKSCEFARFIDKHFYNDDNE